MDVIQVEQMVDQMDLLRVARKVGLTVVSMVVGVVVKLVLMMDMIEVAEMVLMMVERKDQ